MFRQITFVLAFGVAQIPATESPTHAAVLKVYECAIERCVAWDSYKQIDNHNFRVEFTYNHRKYSVFTSKPLLEDRLGRIDFELRPEGASDTEIPESFGCSLDGAVPFKDSSAPYGYSGKRPGYLS
ncbi:MAG TPA: hypothetical protein VKY31_11395, partial [Terriglobia bacterium]|nr:hypothetical protein [Terriglobia bacterium]